MIHNMLIALLGVAVGFAFGSQLRMRGVESRLDAYEKRAAVTNLHIWQRLSRDLDAMFAAILEINRQPAMTVRTIDGVRTVSGGLNRLRSEIDSLFGGGDGR